MLYRYLSRLWLVAGLLIFLLALVIGASRYGVPGLNSERQWVLDWLLRDYPVDISATNIDLKWQDGGLVLQLEHVTQKVTQKVSNTKVDSSKPYLLQADKLYLHLKVWRSVQAGHLVFDSLRIDGLDIGIDTRQMQGGSKKTVNVDSMAPVTGLLLRQIKGFSLRNSTIHIRSGRIPLQTLTIKSLSWLNQDRKHQGSGFVHFGNDPQANYARFILNIAGNPDFPSSMHSELYIDTSRLDYRQQIPARDKMFDSYGIELWSHFKGVQLLYGTMLLAPGSVNWKEAKQQHSLALLPGGRIDFKRFDKDWIFKSTGIKTQLDKQLIRPWNFLFENNGQRINGQIDDIELLSLSRHLPQLFPGKDWAERLYRLEPTGALAQLRFNAPEDLSDFSLTGHLDKVSWHSLDWIPGVKKLDGAFEIHRRAGELTLDTGAQRLGPSSLFAKSPEIKRVSLPLRWSLKADGWQLQSSAMALQTSDLELKAQFKLSFPDDGRPRLAAYGEINLSKAENAKNYYPRGVMAQTVIDYLSPTLLKGSVKQGQLLWYGRFDQFPFDKHQGVFDIHVPLRNAIFRFDSRWQPLTGLDLDLEFKNDSLTMRSHNLEVGKGHSSDLTARFAHLRPDAILAIDAKIDATGQAVSDYLWNSPLQASIGQTLRQVQVKGPLKGDLSLRIPIDHRPPRVKGQVYFHNNNLHLAMLNLPLDKVSGTLNFSDHDSSMQQLKANLYGQPIRIDYTGVQQADSFKVNIETKGKWRDTWLADVSGMPIDNWISGQANWSNTLELDLWHQKGYRFRSRLKSDLTTINSTLPSPLNKAPGVQWPLEVEVIGDETSAQWAGSIANRGQVYGNVAYGQGDPKIQRLQFLFGDRPQHKPKSSGSGIWVALRKLDLADWLSVLNKVDLSKVNANASQRNDLWPDQWQIMGVAEQLDFDGLPKQSARFTGALNSQGLNVNFASGKMTGELKQIKGSDLPVELHLNNLRYKRSHVSPSSSLQGQLKTATEWLKHLPWIQFSCSHCTFGTSEFDDLGGEIVPLPDALELSKLKIKLGDSELTAGGRWQYGTGNKTSLQGQLQSGSLEKLLQKFAYQSPLTNTPLQSNFVLSWRGAPYDFALGKLNGHFSIQTEGGALSEVSDRGARLLSILSLDSLLRKLRLDFHDVFDKGFPFDSASLSGVIHSGVIENRDLKIAGAAGNISGNGKADLGRWTVDYNLNFSPNLTSSLPILAAFAITPITGIYVYALSKIFGPVIDVITEIKFKVSGDLSNPQLEEIRKVKGKAKLPPRNS